MQRPSLEDGMENLMRRIVGAALAAFCIVPFGGLAAQHYAMRMRSVMATDGTVAFACISQPFIGAVAFLPDPAYSSGVTAIVVPEPGWRAFLARRYPAPWYYAASADYATGRTFTPAVRTFLRATGRETTVGYEAEGTTFGGIGSTRIPIAAGRSEADLAEVDAAIGNCSLAYSSAGSGSRRR